MPLFRCISQVFALLIACTFAGPACADAGLPPRSSDLTFLFKNLDEFPNHDFYLRYTSGRGRPQSNLRKVESGTPTHLAEQRLGTVSLIAVPKGFAIPVPDKPAPDKPAEDWLRDAGGLKSQALPGDGAGAPLGSYNGYDITYRVRMVEDRLEVEWVESNLNAWWSNARLIAILIGAACILVPIAIIVLVVWVIVRLTKRPAAGES